MILRNFKLFSLLFLLFSSILLSQALLYPDSDGDGITDKLEIFAGLNPKEDECQPRKCRGISIQGSINGEYLILLIGQNLSMKEKGFEGDSKLTSVKSILKDYIQYSPNFIKMGAYSYGSQGCTSFNELQSPFKNGSKSSLIKEIDSLQPQGSSSIAYSLDKLSEELKEKVGKFNIMVIGDSSESCEGNLKQSIQNLLALNSFQRGIKVFFVGMQISIEKPELENLFESPQSKFIPVDSYSDLKKIFDYPIREVINSLRGMVCIQVELDDLIRCESNKLNQLKRISIKKLNNPIDKDFSMAEKDYFLQQIPIVESKSKIKLRTYDLFKKDASLNYQKKIIELSKIIALDSR